MAVQIQWWFPVLAVVVACGCERAPESLPAVASSVPVSASKPTLTDEQLVADAVLRIVLTANELKRSRSFYGTEGQRELVLLSGGADWPDGEFPSVAGYTVHSERHEALNAPGKLRTLGIRLDKFDLSEKPKGKSPFDSGIVVTLLNAGGSGSVVIEGGCLVYLTPRKDENGWVVDVNLIEDP